MNQSVILMPAVWIQMVATCVPVMLVSLELDSSALVCVYMYILYSGNVILGFSFGQILMSAVDKTNVMRMLPVTIHLVAIPVIARVDTVEMDGTVQVCI